MCIWTFLRLSLKICEGLCFDYEPRIRCQARHPLSEKYIQIHKMQLTGKRIKDKISPSSEFRPYIALFNEKIALPLRVLHDFNLIERESIFKRRFHNRSRVSLNSLTWGIDWWREKILPVTILDPSVVLLKVPNSFPYTVYDICRQTEYIETQTVVYRL